MYVLFASNWYKKNQEVANKDTDNRFEEEGREKTTEKKKKKTQEGRAGQNPVPSPLKTPTNKFY